MNSIFFSNKGHNARKQFYFAILFPLFTIIALGLDSVLFKEKYFDGRQITILLAVIYFFLFFWYSDAHLRKLMFVMVFLSYIGELIFCTLLGMYDYRTDNIPLYVPLGHAIVYASGFVFAHTNWAVKREKSLKKYFAIGFIVLFLFVGIFLKDTFSLIFGVFFFLALKKKKMAKLVLFHCRLCRIY